MMTRRTRSSTGRSAFAAQAAPEETRLVKGDKVEVDPTSNSCTFSHRESRRLAVPKFVAFEQSPVGPRQAPEGVRRRPGCLRWRLEKDILTGESMLDENNKPKWTSNGRLVKWSDGSMQLIVGRSGMILSSDR